MKRLWEASSKPINVEKITSLDIALDHQDDLDIRIAVLRALSRFGIKLAENTLVGGPDLPGLEMYACFCDHHERIAKGRLYKRLADDLADDAEIHLRAWQGWMDWHRSKRRAPLSGSLFLAVCSAYETAARWQRNIDLVRRRAKEMTAVTWGPTSKAVARRLLSQRVDRWCEGMDKVNAHRESCAKAGRKMPKSVLLTRILLGEAAAIEDVLEDVFKGAPKTDAERLRDLDAGYAQHRDNFLAFATTFFVRAQLEKQGVSAFYEEGTAILVGQFAASLALKGNQKDALREISGDGGDVREALHKVLAEELAGSVSDLEQLNPSGFAKLPSSLISNALKTRSALDDPHPTAWRRREAEVSIEGMFDLPNALSFGEMIADGSTATIIDPENNVDRFQREEGERQGFRGILKEAALSRQEREIVQCLLENPDVISEHNINVKVGRLLNLSPNQVAQVKMRAFAKLKKAILKIA